MKRHHPNKRRCCSNNLHSLTLSESKYAMKKIFLSLLILTTFCFASENAVKSTIRYYAIWDTHVDVRIQAGVYANPSTCSDTRFFRLDISERDPLSLTMLAQIIKAYETSEEVTFVIDGCLSNAPKIIAMRVGTY